MKQRFLTKILATLALVAGVFCCSGAVAKASVCPWNVHFTVTHNGDSFTYNLQQNLPSGEPMDRFFCGKNSKKQLFCHLLQQGLPLDAACNYLLPNFGNVVEHFAYLCKTRVDATVAFDKNGFAFTNGENGVAVDERQLLLLALQSGGNHVTFALPLVVDKAVTVQDLQANTALKGTFTTTFEASTPNRCHNIALATEKICGTVVGVGQTFSFNQVVGKRTEANGFRTSKVILDGAYADGIGGGVCQVSTTLYNALLLAGIVPNACQHTLVPSYVLPGFDAMVSDGGADLTFVNNTNHPLYLSGAIKGKSVTFSVFGEPNECTVERQSNSVRTPFNTVFVTDGTKYPHLVYDNQTQVVTNGSDGVKSQSFLLFYQSGKLIATKQIRANNYKRVDKVVARGALPSPERQTDGQNGSQVAN